MHRNPLKPVLHVLLAVALSWVSLLGHAATGMAELKGLEGDGPVTVFFPSAAPAQTVKRGPLTLQLAVDAPPARGNGRLVVISHGSGGAPWGHADIARVLVDHGFVVAMPEHRADNYRDSSEPGPDSWKRRPAEVSRTIDALQADARFAPLLDFEKVGMYGMSAGGLTALVLAGGRWSPSEMARHCAVHIADDFHSCVGLTTRLRGNVFDSVKKTMALWAIGARFSDPRWYSHHDPRIAAVVAGVPYAAVFDMASLAEPRVPLALVTAGQDKWLVPRFHSDRVRDACKPCTVLAHMEQAGHGALLSPFPSHLDGLVAELLEDGPGFDRSQLREVDTRIALWLRRQLLGPEAK